MDELELSRLGIFIKEHLHYDKNAITISIVHCGVGTSYVCGCKHCKKRVNITNYDMW